nr:DNRLRE domain-containing protein [Xenococcaceae cyanobacterium MO_167.B52]
NLVTINDAAENQWLKDTFGTTEALFIGFSDAETEGTWKWASGETIDWVLGNPNNGIYADWSPEQPDDRQGNQDYAILSHIWNSNTDKWDDVTNGAHFRGIIEIDWSSVGGNDTVFGGAGNDQIYGNSGNDLLYGDYAEDNPTATQTISETLSFQQGVNGYAGTVDTQLHGYYWTTNYGNATSLGVDSNDYGYPVHTLMKFDDIFGSQQGQIASDSTIESAILELNVSNPGSSFKVHEMLKNWSENSTWYSWDNYDNGVSANGVEAKSAAVATTGWVSNGILRIDVTESLQAWQANPSSNQGWAFLPTGSDGVDFSSSEGGNAPRLVVDVTQQTSVSDSTVGEGDDKITGNGGNDTIYGGAGDDILEGTDEIVAGYYENDVLVGGAGADKFILGNQQQAYYATGGYQDYAVIQDFDPTADTIQFYGSAANYQSQQQGNDTFVSRNGDLVVILENTSNLNLSSSAFEYVNGV